MPFIFRLTVPCARNAGKAARKAAKTYSDCLPHTIQKDMTAFFEKSVGFHVVCVNAENDFGKWIVLEIIGETSEIVESFRHSSCNSSQNLH